MRIKFVDKAIKLYKRITGRFEPITSKCVHDNIFAIAGQSAFFIILSAVPLSMFFVSLLQNLHIPIDFVYHGLSSVFSSKIADDLGFQRSEISSYLNGKRKLSVDKIEAVLEYLGAKIV